MQTQQSLRHLESVQESLILSIVIPALNEADGIEDILQRLHDAGKALGKIGIESFEIIVVDDGSRDETARIVSALPYVRLVRHWRNRGYGAAIKTGFKRARGNLLAFLDGDSTYPPESLNDLCRALLNQDADVVVGSRRSGSSSRMPFSRRLGNFFWSSLLSFLGKTPVKDPASGMRVLRRKSLPFLYPLPDGLNFTPVMSTRAVHEGLKVVEVPIPYHKRSGASKLSTIKDGTRFLKTIVWTALEYNPAGILSSLGVMAVSAAISIGAGLVALRLQGITEVGPFGVFVLYAALVLAVTGVSIISLGITFNYLVALVHGKPIFQTSFAKAILGPNLDRHFGWMGVSVAILGTAIGTGSLYLGLKGWEIERLWLWLLGSALFVVVGIQLVLSWILMRVLEAVNERDTLIRSELEH
jgi:hypothetical protein